MKTIYKNGAVYTGKLPLVEAFAVEDGKFVFAGSSAEADALAAAGDKVVDLGGKFVCSGFNDSHMHLLNYGSSLLKAQLAAHTESLEDMLACLDTFQKEHPRKDGAWLMGRGWNQDYFTDVDRMPNRYDLDRVSTEVPICATRACGHCLVVNSKALELLGVTADTPQPEGGEIGMENGEPDGRFFDNAMEPVYDSIPVPSKEEIKDMIRSACKALNSYGVTSSQSDDYCVYRAVPWQTVNEAYKELEESGELTVRVYEQSNFTDLESLKGLAENPREDHRHGIVHCQITRADQLEKIAKMHLHVYAQSIFLDYDNHIVEERVGKELASTSYSWKTLMNNGVSVSNGTDCPVELPDALACMQCAVTRTTLRDHVGPYLPDQKFTVQEALDSYTIRSAEASFEENVKGQIAEGMMADFVVLGQNPFEVDESTIKDIPVCRTYLAGELVYEA